MHHSTAKIRARASSKPATLTPAFLALAVMLACGAASCERLHRAEIARYAAWGGIAPAIKPAGVVLATNEEEEEEGLAEMGPPPYAYWRITGEPVPDWDARQAPGGYEGRASPFVWTFLGPRPVTSEYWSYENNAGGRVVSMAPHPTDPNTAYIATASGGIWKTTNGGTAWTPLTDELSTLNHGVVALDPSNPQRVVIGTGEYTTGSTGDGLFQSADGGVRWTRLATAARVGSNCSGIALHPADPAVIHVTSSSGWFRTANTGGTWTTVVSGNFSALRMDASNPLIVYAARRGIGIYKSTNGGLTATLLAGGLPTTGFDRIVMDVARSNPRIIYAAFMNGADLLSMHRSTDAGATWTLMGTVPNFCTPQCWYDAYVAVDPTTPDVLYCGGVDARYRTAGVIRSADGGVTWTEVASGGNGLHPDHHAMAFGPNGVVWEGNDGGISKSVNGGTSWINLNATLAATQMYHVAVHPNASARILAGTQDNGTPERAAATTSWDQLQTGDGGFSAFDPTNTTRRYTTYVYLAITRWDGTSGTSITGPWTADATSWIAPLVMSPGAPATLLGGTNRVWRTTNATASTPTWTAISAADLGGTGTLDAIAVAASSPDTIYAGGGQGMLWVTRNGTAASPQWVNRSAGRTGAVSAIVVDPANPGVAFTASRSTSGPRVHRTDTFGQAWRDVTGSLPPGAAARALAVDFRFQPPVMYVGAGSGVYVSFDGGASWIKDDETFPNVNIGSMVIDAATQTLTVGTYGRGVWRTPLAIPPQCLADYNRDGGVDGGDVQAFITDWVAGVAGADVNQDGGVDGADVASFFVMWEAGGC
ncbi:MAG: GC-type dockerin domain-anchored protein [Phycisphaerae bacterium]